MCQSFPTRLESGRLSGYCNIASGGSYPRKEVFNSQEKKCAVGNQHQGRGQFWLSRPGSPDCPKHPLTPDRTVAQLHSRVDFYEESNDAISLDSEEEELLYLKGRIRAQAAQQKCSVNDLNFKCSYKLIFSAFVTVAVKKLVKAGILGPILSIRSP